jgi:glycosyltransferase involved in cell wall biosynthesis
MSESSERGTILFVSPGPELVTPASGEGTRLKHLSQELADEWDILALVPESAAAESPPWVRQQYTYAQWSLPFLTDLNPSFVRALGRILQQEDVDVVHLSRGVCAAQVLSNVLRSETIINHASQNVEAEHATDFVDPDLPIHKRLLGPRLIPAIERMAVRCAGSVTTVSEADRESLIERYEVDPDRIRAIPTGTTIVDDAQLENPEVMRERHGIDSDIVAVFHGSYAHPPNEEAVELLAERVAPAVRERGVDVEFLLVGKGMPEVQDPNITSAGFVEDLFSTLNAADFAVVPILHGGGTKTKVYDYLSLGLPLVSTKKGVEGIDVEDGVHGIMTTGVNEKFVDAVNQMALDEEVRQEAGTKVRKFGRERTWERSGGQLTGFF